MSNFKSGDFVEVFRMPGDTWNESPDWFQAGDRFTIQAIQDFGVFTPYAGDGKGKWIMVDRIRKLRPPESYKGQYDTNSRTFRDVMNNPGRKIEAPDMVEVYREIQQRIKS
jgi:hypothetical protein